MDGIMENDSLIKVSIPFTQQRLNAGATAYTCLQSSTTTNLGCSEQSNDTDYRYYTMTEWLCSSSLCQGGLSFSTQLIDARNPPVAATEANTKTYEIEILNSANVTIHKCDTTTKLLAEPELNIPKITNMVITH